MTLLSRMFSLCRRRASSESRVVETVTVGGITATVVEVDDVFEDDEWPHVPEVGDFVTTKLVGRDGARQGWVKEVVLADGRFVIVGQSGSHDGSTIYDPDTGLPVAREVREWHSIMEAARSMPAASAEPLTLGEMPIGGSGPAIQREIAPGVKVSDLTAEVGGLGYSPAPATPSAGSMHLDMETGSVREWDGMRWVERHSYAPGELDRLLEEHRAAVAAAEADDEQDDGCQCCPCCDSDGCCCE